LRDAFYVATHSAARVNGEIRITPGEPDAASKTEFLMLKDGTIAFEGDAGELRKSDDEYVRAFLS
jgi:hypothetical protein